MTRILLARHGETDWNHEERWQGHSDRPLNATGHRQAQALARRLAVEGLAALYTSDLVRARETAAAVERVTGLAAAGRRKIAPGANAGLTVVERRGDRSVLVALNESGHLV